MIINSTIKNKKNKTRKNCALVCLPATKHLEHASACTFLSAHVSRGTAPSQRRVESWWAECWDLMKMLGSSVTPAVETRPGPQARSRYNKREQVTTLGPEIYWLIVIHLDLSCGTGKQQWQRRHRPSSVTPEGHDGGTADRKDRHTSL